MTSQVRGCQVARCGFASRRDEKSPSIAEAVHVNKDDLDASIGDQADIRTYPSGETKGDLSSCEQTAEPRWSTKLFSEQ